MQCTSIVRYHSEVAIGASAYMLGIHEEIIITLNALCIMPLIEARTVGGTMVDEAGTKADALCVVIISVDTSE